MDSPPRHVSDRAHSYTWRRAGAILVVGVALGGCVQTGALRARDTVPVRVGASKILLVNPDVELVELTAAGLEEPKAEWTATGRANVERALGEILGRRNASIVNYDPPKEASRAHAHDQLLKLHRAVGASILQHKFNAPLSLPTKESRFDWTLGEGIRTLDEHQDADYALFLFLRDSYASDGRVAIMVAMALFGVVMPGGLQAGFASLVDMETGAVVWFNRLVSSTGDLRALEPAREAVERLLTDIPI